MVKKRKMPEIDEDGLIKGGEYGSLYVRPLLDAMRESAWDWPSAMMALEMPGAEDASMYPSPEDEHFKYLVQLAPEENWKDFNFSWDT